MKPGKLAAVVVMYHPEPIFLEYIFSYLGSVDRLYIIDNSETIIPGFFARLENESKIRIIAGQVNHGVAKALNMGASEAVKEGYSWMLTMDQDSFFDPATFSKYLDAFTRFEKKNEVAVFGIPYDKKFLDKIPADQIYWDVNSLITSGSLINLELFSRLHGFDEKLFIDEVDHDYCYRAKIAGFRVVCIRAGLMSHALGKEINVSADASDNISGKKTLHSPLRIYYIVRNGLYVSRHFKADFPEQSKKRKKIIFVTVKNNLFHGDQKLKVLRYALLGWWHFLTGRFYKL